MADDLFLVNYYIKDIDITAKYRLLNNNETKENSKK